MDDHPMRMAAKTMKNYPIALKEWEAECLAVQCNTSRKRTARCCIWLAVI
jgi:hypothetical protein